jgi:hypothetical protein
VPTEAHVHQGSAGTSGPVVATLSLPPPEGATGACVALPGVVIDAILADPASFYVDLHTDEFPDGAVRGQLELSMCTLVGWGPDHDPQGEGTSDLFVREGDRVQIRGTYWDGAVVAFTLARDGVAEVTDTATVSGWAEEWFFPFDHDDGGDWTFSAAVPGVGQCEDVMAITVQDVGDAPTEPPPSQPIPDTAVTSRIQTLDPTLIGIAMVVVGVMAGANRARREA